jgi:hypothetical protein
MAGASSVDTTLVIASGGCRTQVANLRLGAERVIGATWTGQKPAGDGELGLWTGRT